MKITYEKTTDSMYIYFVPEEDKKKSVRCVELGKNIGEIIADYDEDGKLLGIEILDAAYQYGKQIITPHIVITELKMPDRRKK